jgi:hypothetical protein
MHETIDYTPAQTLLSFQPTMVPIDNQDPMPAWTASDHKYNYAITREIDAECDAKFDAEIIDDSDQGKPDQVYRVYIRQLDGSHPRRLGRKFETLEDAINLCSIYTREFRRQVAYHEAGHAVVAHLLGCTGVWVEMDDGANRAITRHDFLPPVLAIADASLGGGGRTALARYLYEDLMFTVAGTVAEAKIAGYRTSYVEEDVAGRTNVAWGAVRVARIEAGLPICGHQDCEIPPDAGVGAERVTPEHATEHATPEHVTPGCVAEQDVAAVMKRLNASRSRGIIGGIEHEHADAPHAVALLGARRERPRRRAAEERDERAPKNHSITSSARSRIDSGTVSPSALAVLRFTTISNLVGNCTGRSPGFSPRRMRST